jgi:hypothetical protein
VEVGTNFSDGARVLARIGDNQQMVIPIPIIFLFLKQRTAMVLTHLDQKTRPGFMIRRNVANRRNLKSIIVMHRPLLFPESIEIMVMLLVSSGM